MQERLIELQLQRGRLLERIAAVRLAQAAEAGPLGEDAYRDLVGLLDEALAGVGDLAVGRREVAAGALLAAALAALEELAGSPFLPHVRDNVIEVTRRRAMQAGRNERALEVATRLA